MTVLALAALAIAMQKPKTKPAPPKKPANSRKAPAQKAKAPMLVTVDAKPNDSISGERTFRVSVQSDDPVTQVEFYVGPDLRDSDSSVPYQFKLDTIEESDGPLRLRFKAYTSTGKSAERTVTIVVANDVAAGAPAHVSRGRDLLGAGQPNNAVTEGRIALKADPNSADAKLLLGTAYYQLRIYDRAQKYAEDVLAVRKDDREALNLLSSIAIRQAFGTFSRGTDGAAESAIAARLTAGIDARRRAAEASLDALGAPTDANVIAIADAANAAGRYSVTINALEPILRTKPERQDALERILFAQVRSGKYSDAAVSLRNAARFLPVTVTTVDGREQRVPDFSAYALAISALLAENSGKSKEADGFMKRAVLKNADDLGVRTTQAYLALRRDDKRILAQAAADLLKDAAANPVAQFYVGAVASRQQRYDAARDAFLTAALADPLLRDLYIENGLRSLAIADAIKADTKPAPDPNDPAGAQQETEEEKKEREKKNAEEEKKAEERRKPYYKSADTMFRAALAAKPDSADALTALAATALLEKRVGDAVRNAEGAAAAAPESVSAQLGLAAALAALARVDRNNAVEIRTRAVAASKRAEALNTSLIGRGIPQPQEVWKYLAGAGRTPVIAAPR